MSPNDSLSHRHLGWPTRQSDVALSTGADKPIEPVVSVADLAAARLAEKQQLRTEQLLRGAPHS